MEQKILLPYLEDLADRAQTRGMAHSKFLSPAEGAEAALAFQNRRDILFCLDGGFAEAERCIAVFQNSDFGQYHREETLAALRLQHRRQDSLSHRDILGAALGLGLEREMLGDILVEPDGAWLVCLAPMAEFLCRELTRAGKVGVKVGRVVLAELPDISADLPEKTLSLASLRLDAFVAAAFGLPRERAREAVAAGQVQLAHRACQSPAKQVEPGQVVTLRGRGRVKLLATEGETRKGRLKARLGYYR